MTAKTQRKLAASAALMLGALSIASGGAVLLGLKQPDYLVLPWLVWYNTVMGAVSLVAGLLLWQQRSRGECLAVAIASLHGAILLTLVVRYFAGSAVATQSIGAMVFRTFIWAGILRLLRMAARVSDPVDATQKPSQRLTSSSGVKNRRMRMACPPVLIFLCA